MLIQNFYLTLSELKNVFLCFSCFVTADCPRDSLKCADEDYCLPRDQVCDRVVNCEKYTDEIDCGKFFFSVSIQAYHT